MNEPPPLKCVGLMVLYILSVIVSVYACIIILCALLMVFFRLYDYVGPGSKEV